MEESGTDHWDELPFIYEEMSPCYPEYDEYEEELKLVQVVSDDEVRVDGKIRIDDLNEVIKTDLAEKEDYDTIAGYLYNLLGRVPSEGEEYEADGLRLVVEKVTGQRIERVIIRGDGVGKAARENTEL